MRIQIICFLTAEFIFFDIIHEDYFGNKYIAFLVKQFIVLHYRNIQRRKQLGQIMSSNVLQKVTIFVERPFFIIHYPSIHPFLSLTSTLQKTYFYSDCLYHQICHISIAEKTKTNWLRRFHRPSIATSLWNFLNSSKIARFSYIKSEVVFHLK